MPGRPASFLTGFGCPLQAAAFVLRRPSLWPWCIAPIVINVVVVVGVWWWVGELSREWLAGAVTKEGWAWTALRFALSVLLVLLRIVAALAAFVIFGNIASTPFNDFLSERVDRILTGWTQDEPFSLRRQALRILTTIAQEAKRLGIFLALTSALFIASFFPLATPVTASAQVLLTAWFLALDYVSYPLERRGTVLLGRKMAFVRANGEPCLGFGAAMAIICMVPLVNFVFIPIGVVGGTLLYARLAGALPGNHDGGDARA
jgi:CysZ protein